MSKNITVTTTAAQIMQKCVCGKTNTVLTADKHAREKIQDFHRRHRNCRGVEK